LDDTNEIRINQLLRNARLSFNWSQQELASRLNTTIVNVSRWERRVTSPGPHFRKLLCELFGKSVAELGLLRENENELAIHNSQQEIQREDVPSQTSTLIWRVPHRRNPFFIGREEILLYLHNTFHASKLGMSAQAQALSGLGGIGKTQTAIEYAYRFRNNYSVILWLRAETYEVLMSDACAIANLLELPEKDEQNQSQIVEAVKCWLTTHDNWLLVLDNVEDFTLIEDYLPQQGKGHIVLTTRTQVTGAIAQRLDLKLMGQDEGASLLLRRAKLLHPDAALEEVSEALQGIAKELSQELGGLPLALDQAGAYIEETGCTLSAYRTHYQTQGVTLLGRRGRMGGKHPHSVSTTFSLCFEKVKHLNEAAGDVLHLCGFLAPDAIPEELFHTDGFDLGSHLQSLACNPLAFDDAVATLRTYSLLQRDAETKTLTMHRLVQTVLRETMDEKMQHHLAEQAVRVVNHILPDIDGDVLASQHFSFFSHAQQCAVQIERYRLLSPEAGQLLTTLAEYEQVCAQYVQAKKHLAQAQEIYEQMNETTHPEMHRVLSVLAKVWYKQGKYVEAEQLCHRSLALSEHIFGEDHPKRADCLTILALTLYKQGRYAVAETLFRRVLLLDEQQGEQKQLDIAITLSNLGLLLCEQGKYGEAETLLQRSVTIKEQLVGTEHIHYANALHNLAVLYIEWGKHTEAKSLFQHILVIREKHLGKDHPEVAVTYNNLCRISYLQEDYTEAEQCIRCALHIHEKIFGQDHLQIATGLNNLAKIVMAQGYDAEAELFFQRALQIYERDLGQEHPYRAITLGNLALLYTKQKRWSEAEGFFQQALAIHKKTVGLEHPHVAQTLQNMALLSLEQEQYEQAECLHQQAIALQEKIVGRAHPTTISMQEHYQKLCRTLQERKRK